MNCFFCRLRLAAFTVLLLLAACASAPVPADLYYSLTPTPEAGLSPLKARLMVEPLQLGGVYAERPLLFRRGMALAQYRHQFWSESPALMWRNALIDHLRASGAANVVTPETRVVADYVIRGRIKRMEQILDQDVQALLALEFAVTDVTGHNLLLIEFEEQQVLASDEPADYAGAINQLAGRAFAQLNADLREKLLR